MGELWDVLMFFALTAGVVLLLAGAVYVMADRSPAHLQHLQRLAAGGGESGVGGGGHGGHVAGVVGGDEAVTGAAAWLQWVPQHH